MRRVLAEPFSPKVNTIPHHLSESIFRHFEPHITLAVRNWPEETCFDLDLTPTGEKKYSPATFVGRFRDSILSLQRFKWEPTTIDVAKLWTLSAEKAFTVWWEAGTSKIWFKHRRRPGRPSHLVGEARALVGDRSFDPPPPSVVLHKDLTREELLSFCVLIANRRLEGPVRYEGRPPADDDAVRLWDVAFTWDEGKNITIIT